VSRFLPLTPGDPALLLAPGCPVAPVAPHAPVEPSLPVEPIAPVAPVAPVGPKQRHRHQSSKSRHSHMKRLYTWDFPAFSRPKRCLRVGQPADRAQSGQAFFVNYGGSGFLVGNFVGVDCGLETFLCYRYVTLYESDSYTLRLRSIDLRSMFLLHSRTNVYQ